jgi:hypothetical protein
MPGKQGVQVRKVRAELDGVTLALVDWQEAESFVRLRIEQAIRRAGLGDLLAPALEDLDRMGKSVQEAKSQVSAAVRRLE